MLQESYYGPCDIRGTFTVKNGNDNSDDKN